MRRNWRGAPKTAGVALVTVHGRTRCQFYGGKADWQAIARVREAISIPLIANGDGDSMPADARAMLAQSGADGVMIGRGAYGRPWWPGVIADGLEPGSGRRRALADRGGRNRAASSRSHPVASRPPSRQPRRPQARRLGDRQARGTRIPRGGRGPGLARTPAAKRRQQQSSPPGSGDLYDTCIRHRKNGPPHERRSSFRRRRLPLPRASSTALPNPLVSSTRRSASAWPTPRPRITSRPASPTC